MNNEIGILGLRDGYDPEVMTGLTGMSESDIKKKIDENMRIEIVNNVYEDFEARRTERLPLELQWRLTVNYLSGNQFMKINSATSDIEETEVIAWFEERETFNQLAPIFETRLAKLNRVQTDLKLRPATSESDDVANAKVSGKILESNFKALKYEKKQRKANVWSERTGTAFFKPHWNLKKGTIVGYDEHQMKEEDISDLPDFERELRMTGNTKQMPIFNGDVDCNVCSAFEIYPDSIYHSSCEDARSIIHAKVYSVDEVYDNWKEKLKGGDFNVFSIENGKMANGSLGDKTSAYQIQNSTRKNSVLVLEKWELPTILYPDGRLIIIGVGADKKTLFYYGKLPYRLGEDDNYLLPFVEQKCIDYDDFFGISVYDRLLPLQRRYNSLRNRKKEYLNRVAIGQLVFEEGSIDEDAMTDDVFGPGAMISYIRGYNPPKYMDTPNLPSAFDSEEATLSVDFNRISGVSEIARDSKAPTGVGSGIALSILKEQDDTRLSITGSYISEAKKQVGKMFLKLQHDNVDYERQLRHVGKDEEVSLQVWSSQSITSYDVYFDESSSLSETPAQRRQMVFDLLQTGILTSGVDKRMFAKIFEVMQLGNWEDFAEDIDIHTDKASRENRAMVKGESPTFLEFDNHDLHITKHEEFMLSADFAELLVENPNMNDLFIAHRAEHVQVLQARQMNQIAQEQQQMQTQVQQPTAS